MAKHLLYVNFDAFDSRYVGMAPTPVLDQMAAEGVLYRQARAGIPTITPCMQTSIVTGAWPVTHGNTYRYYDSAARQVLQTARENSAETIAEVAERHGLSTGSVQQFTLKDRGTYPDRPRHRYVEPGGGMATRVKAALELLHGPEPPRFLAFYADDLDAIGHNHGIHESYAHLTLAGTEAERVELTLERLVLMDRLLGTLIDALPADTALCLTADHGMVGFSGRSVLPRVLDRIRSRGLVPELLAAGMAPSEGTDLAVLSTGLQVQLRWVQRPTAAQDGALAEVLDGLAGEDWFGGWLDREALGRAGAHPAFADLLLWPREGVHCHVQDEADFPVLASHDTPLASVVPLLFWGAGVRRVAAPEGTAAIIDAAPTMARLLGIPAPVDATGRVLHEVIME